MYEVETAIQIIFWLLISAACIMTAAVVVDAIRRLTGK